MAVSVYALRHLPPASRLIAFAHADAIKAAEHLPSFYAPDFASSALSFCACHQRAASLRGAWSSRAPNSVASL